jgi:hypothetical protein
MCEPGQVVKAGSWHNAKKWLRLQSFCMTNFDGTIDSDREMFFSYR